jgi:hypothetical protein
MMTGHKIKMTASEFTCKKIESLKRSIKGTPIIVDDILNQRFKAQAIEMIPKFPLSNLTYATEYALNWRNA